MNDPNVVSDAEWAVWQEGYDAPPEWTAKRTQPVDALTEQVEDLEVGLWFAQECLSASLTLLSETRQQLAFERSVTAGLLSELPAERHLRAA